MTKVNFYRNVDDSLFQYAVLIARHEDKWVFSRHRDRNTLEFPGGKRILGESIDDTARRELYEETGASCYNLYSLTPYSVENDGTETYGMLYAVEIKKFDKLPQSEIDEIFLLSDLPLNWTYPEIQPYLLKYYDEWKKNVSRETI